MKETKQIGPDNLLSGQLVNIDALDAGILEFRTDKNAAKNAIRDFVRVSLTLDSEDDYRRLAELARTETRRHCGRSTKFPIRKFKSRPAARPFRHGPAKP